MWLPDEKSVVESPCNFRNTDGFIILSNRDRIIWTPGLKAEPQMAISVAIVKAQLITPPTSAKILLKLTLNDDRSFKFQFPSISEREQFKNGLAAAMNRVQQQRQPQNPALSSEDIKIRQAVLARNLEIRKLHKELVIKGPLSEQEFWESRKELLDDFRLQEAQKVGLSSSFTADIQPTSQQGSEIRYTLTPSTIQSIFVHHPKIKQVYDDNVPKKMDEKEFWTRCFQSAFFFRDKFASKTKDPIFDVAALEEEEELLANPEKRDLDLFLLDLGATIEDHRLELEKEDDVNLRAKSKNISVIRRLNRHGDVIVRMGEQRKSATETMKDVPRHKQILREVTRLNDLEVQQTPSLGVLNIASNVTELTQSTDIFTEETKASLKNHINGMKNVTIRACQSVDTKYCDISFKRFIKRIKADSSNEATLNYAVGCLPADVYQEVQALNAALNELLRHYYLVHESASSSALEKKGRVMMALKEAKSKVEACCQSLGDPAGQATIRQILGPTIAAATHVLSE